MASSTEEEKILLHLRQEMLEFVIAELATRAATQKVPVLHESLQKAIEAGIDRAVSAAAQSACRIDAAAIAEQVAQQLHKQGSGIHQSGGRDPEGTIDNRSQKRRIGMLGRFLPALNDERGVIWLKVTVVVLLVSLLVAFGFYADALTQRNSTRAALSAAHKDAASARLYCGRLKVVADQVNLLRDSQKMAQCEAGAGDRQILCRGLARVATIAGAGSCPSPAR